MGVEPSAESGLLPRTRAASLSKLHRNTLANVAGRLSTALLGLAFIPTYVRLLGVEAYGLIGFFATLQTLFTLLDLGLSTTLNRELARSAILSKAAGEQRNLVRTFETFYWLAALVIAVTVILSARLLATRWVQPHQLTVDSVATAIRLMGVGSALQFAFTLYQGGLAGLQKQVALNVIVILSSILRFAGVIPVLLLVSPTVQAFFAWQIFVSAMQVAAGAYLLWHYLPRIGQRARASWSSLAGIRRFAAGMTGISLTVVVLVQMDKVVLSRILSLKDFGYYTLAGVIGGGILTLVSPIFVAAFPRLSQLVAQKDSAGVAQFYHRACQAVSIAVLPLAVVLSLHASEFMLLWTGNAEIASKTALLVVLLTIGTTLNALMNIPYALQLANGETRLALYSNVVAIALLLPTLIILTRQFGAPGAAAVWVILNAAYVLVVLRVTHRLLLPNEDWLWYSRDVGPPLLSALGTALLVGVLIHDSTSRPSILLRIGVIYFLSLGAAIAAVPWMRGLILTLARPNPR